MTEDTLTARIEAIQQKEQESRVDGERLSEGTGSTAESGQGVQSLPASERRRRTRVNLAAINEELNALDWDPPLRRKP